MTDQSPVARGDTLPTPTTVNVGDTDRNADWIKTEKARRQEALIHEQIAAEIRAEELETGEEV